MLSLRTVGLAVSTLALGACPEHAPSWYGLTDEAPADIGTSSSTGSLPDPATTTDTPGTGTTTEWTTGDLGMGASTSTSTSSPGEPVQPVIVTVDMPDKISLAGPVAFSVTTKDAIDARARLDGVELPLLEHEGDGIFSGVVPIFGAVDNGAHVLQVIAANGPLADLRDVSFEVTTPAPGGVAWAVLHPTGSTTRRIALTPEGDVIEVGSLDVDGIPRPSIRKRSSINAAELWAAGTIVLDEREGVVDDVAMLPDGRMWVAMNVREPSNKWRPRLVLLDALGNETGVEMPGEPGATVRGVDGDGAGGFFAVGFASSGQGDSDVVAWHMNGDHVPVFSAKPWDYIPPQNFPHTFSDFAFDVVVQDGIAWVGGASQGKHDKMWEPHVRGMVVRMDVATGAALDPVIVPPSINAWFQSMFLGVAPHPEGVLVTGNAATLDGTTQRIEVSVFTAAGERTWHVKELAAPVAYGNAVVLNAHGVAVVVGAMQDGGVTRGVVLGRGQSNFELLFPPNNEPTVATGLALDPYDQALVGGYVTHGGVMQARLARVTQ